MDLSPISGLNSRFGAVWEGIWHFSAHSVRFISLNSLVYQRVLGRCFSNLLEDSAPALPVICQLFDPWSLSHWPSCASVMAVTGYFYGKCPRGLVLGIPLLPFEKRPTDKPSPWGGGG